MIGINQIILSSIGGASFTLIINGLLKRHEKLKNLIKQTKIFVNFIDDIILKYLTININQYNLLIIQVEDNDAIFEARVLTESPMLNRTIFDFFDKQDLIKIFSYCKKSSIVEIYHFFYEIDYLQKKSSKILLNDLVKDLEKHYDENKKENESFFDHITYCDESKKIKREFKSHLEIQKKHSEELYKAFKNIKLELLSIEELNEDID